MYLMPTPNNIHVRHRLDDLEKNKPFRHRLGCVRHRLDDLEITRTGSF